MRRAEKYVVCVFFVTALLGLGTPCLAQSKYLPLEPGYWWEYEFPSGYELRTVERVVQWATDGVYAIVTTGTTPNAGLEAYWSNGEQTIAEDVVMLHGFYHPGRGNGRMYDPPIRMALETLGLGDSWHDDVDVYDQQWGNVIAKVRFEHVVEDTGTVVVPAGAFFCAGVRTTEIERGTKIRRPWDPTGRIAHPDGSRAGKTWWAREIGEIRSEVGGQVGELLDVNVTSAVEGTSWGRIKALYR